MPIQVAIFLEVAPALCLFVCAFPYFAGVIGMAVVAPDGMLSYVCALIGLLVVPSLLMICPPMFMGMAVAYSLLWWGSGFSLRLNKQEFKANLRQRPPLLLQASWVTGVGFGLMIGLMGLLGSLTG